MRLKKLISLVTDSLHASGVGDVPRADMFLSERLLAGALVMAVGGIGCGVVCIFKFHIGLVIAAPLLLILAVGAFLCWRNQTIHVIDADTFVYTTFLGNRKVYHFSDITQMRRNRDSYTLYVGNDKVHIDSMALLSERLVALIDARFVPDGDGEETE